MRFKLDENMPESLVIDLSAVGHDAATCRQEGIGGGGDPAIASHALTEGRILVTFDLDFSDIRRYPPGSHPGMVIFRLHSQDIPSCRLAFSRLLAGVPEPDFQGNLIIVEDTRVRIRR
jgi:predicted nuclease of predicted toxin-antitoxin system